MPCRSLFDHGRSLVRQFRDQPFELIGVNFDESVNQARNTQLQYDLPWRSFFDGRRVIETQYGISSIPTVIVVDHKGKVQWIGHHFNDQVVKSLIAQIN